MPALSLMSLATKACIKNIRSLNDVGDFEYWKIRPVLARITSPEQLRQIELASPQICGEDAELWKVFIARDISNWKTKNYVPKNPKKWYQVYQKYKKEQKRDLEKDHEKLREAMMGLKKEKETHVSKVVDPRYLPKVPRDPRMLANDGGVPISGPRSKNKGFLKTAPSALTWSAGSKTKLTDGKSVLTRARREAKEMSARNKLVTPTHALQARSSLVRQAPQGMVNEHRKAAAPPVRILSSRRKQTSALTGISNQHGSVSALSLEERERRLRAMKMGGSSQKSESEATVRETVIGSSSDEDDEDDDGIEDLFNENRAVANSPPPKPSSSRPQRPDTKFYRPSTPKAATSRQTPLAAPKPQPRPSDIISSLITKPKPAQYRHEQKSTVAPARSPPPIQHTSNRASTPDHLRGAGTSSPAPQKPKMMPRKRPEVDIFNRGSANKKQRVG